MKLINKGHLSVVTAAIALMLSWGCKKPDHYNDIVSIDQTKPGRVTNVKVHNFQGGAYITYELPQSENLLYVLAEYKINDSVSRQTKASYYSDTIRVEGFAESKDYDVVLYSVSRAEVRSDSLIVKVHPETPVYKGVYPTLNVVADFGGVHIAAVNNEQKPIGIEVITRNAHNEWDLIEQVYSDDAEISFSIRGYDTIPREFGVYITDRWGNKSDTSFTTITPLFEKEFDKLKFRELRQPSDVPMAYGWVMSNLWNGSIVGSGYHTALGFGMPVVFTFDMGVEGKISRYKIWERNGNEFAFSQGNPKRWALWGTNNPQDDALPADVSNLTPGQTVGSWIFMGYFEAPPKPSGNPIGVNTAEDFALIDAGFEYNISLDVPPVRYFRFQTLETFSGADYMNLMEITLWGKPQ